MKLSRFTSLLLIGALLSPGVVARAQPDSDAVQQLQAQIKALTEAQQRLVLGEERLQARLSLKRRMRGRVGGMMHRDDLEAEVAETWQRILDYPATPVPFSSLYEATAIDVVQTFNSLLFLAKQQRVTVSQEEFPYGEIWVTPKLAEASAVIAEEVKA